MRIEEIFEDLKVREPSVACHEVMTSLACCDLIVEQIHQLCGYGGGIVETWCSCVGQDNRSVRATQESLKRGLGRRWHLRPTHPRSMHGRPIPRDSVLAKEFAVAFYLLKIIRSH